MREKMMNKDYAKAFKTIVIMAVLLALLSARCHPAEPVAADQRFILAAPDLTGADGAAGRRAQRASR